MTDPLTTGWHPIGPAVVRGCPLCPLTVEEPPMEMATDLTKDGLRWRVRQHSAVPALCTHIVVDHPDSDVAADLLARVELHLATKAAGGTA